MPATATFAIPLTPRAPGAIAVILLAGSAAANIIAQVASPKAAATSIGQFTYTRLHHPQTKEALDDGLVVHTAPDRYELHVHGGVAVVDALLAALQSAGTQIITPEQAAQHGLLGGPLEADLVLALPNARTATALQLLTAQTSAGLTAWVRHWLAWLESPCTSADLWPLHSATQWLLTRSATLARLLDPPRIAILGPPNAGKSTLANALLGRPMSITSDTPGTTRDWVDAQAVFIAASPLRRFADSSVAVTLIDTAGIRDTPDPLERESIARAHHQAAGADAIILVYDATQPLVGDQRNLVQSCRTRAPTVVARNKIDLLGGPTEMGHGSWDMGPAPVAISARTHQGLDTLMTSVLAQLDLAAVDPSEPFVFCRRQRALLEQLSTAIDPAGIRAVLQSITVAQ